MDEEELRKQLARLAAREDELLDNLARLRQRVHLTQRLLLGLQGSGAEEAGWNKRPEP